jgi:hypothetical protein
MLAFALFFKAWLAQYAGDAEATLRATDECVAIGDQYGYPHVTAWARVFKGWAMAKRGLAAEGEAAARDAIAALDAIGITLIRPNLLALVAETELLQGRTAEARATLAAAHALAERTEERCYLPQILRLERELPA